MALTAFDEGWVYQPPPAAEPAPVVTQAPPTAPAPAVAAQPEAAPTPVGFQAYDGTGPSLAEINGAYYDILGRQADPEGLKYYDGLNIPLAEIARRLSGDFEKDKASQGITDISRPYDAYNLPVGALTYNNPSFLVDPTATMAEQRRQLSQSLANRSDANDYNLDYATLTGEVSRIGSSADPATAARENRQRRYIQGIYDSLGQYDPRYQGNNASVLPADQLLLGTDVTGVSSLDPGGRTYTPLNNQSGLDPKPVLKDFMERTGLSLRDASSILYGVIGANNDVRNWEAIMGSDDPLSAARAATRALFSDPRYNTKDPQYKTLEETYPGQVLGREGIFSLVKPSSPGFSTVLTGANGSNLTQVRLDADSLNRLGKSYGFDLDPQGYAKNITDYVKLLESKGIPLENLGGNKAEIQAYVNRLTGTNTANAPIAAGQRAAGARRAQSQSTPQQGITSLPQAAQPAFDSSLIQKFQQKQQLMQQGRGLLGAAYDDPFATNEARAQGQALLDQANAIDVDEKQVREQLRQAIGSGQDLRQFYGGRYDDSMRLIQDLGIEREGNILPGSPTGYQGAWRFDPVYGSEYYREYLTGLGQKLGIDQDIINRTAGDSAVKNWYTGNEPVSTIIDNPNYLSNLTYNVLVNGGIDPNSEQGKTILQNAKDTGAKISSGLYSESDSSGVLKQYLNKVILTPEVLATAAIFGGLSAAGVGAGATAGTEAAAAGIGAEAAGATAGAELAGAELAGAELAGAGAATATEAAGIGTLAPIDYGLGTTLTPGTIGSTGLVTTPEMVAGFGLGGGSEVALGSGILANTLPNAASVGGLGQGLTVPTVVNGVSGTITAAGFIPTGSELALGNPNSFINAGSSNFTGAAPPSTTPSTSTPSTGRTVNIPGIGEVPLSRLIDLLGLGGLLGSAFVGGPETPEIGGGGRRTYGPVNPNAVVQRTTPRERTPRSAYPDGTRTETLRKIEYDPVAFVENELGGFLRGFASGGLTTATSGISSIPQMSQGRMVKGPGDGMSDDVPASIEGKEDVLLANDEYIIPAQAVSALGNGSSEAGGKILDAMVKRVYKEQTGKPKQMKPMNLGKVLPK